MTFTNLLIALILFLLVIVVLSQIAKLGDLLRSLTSKKDKEEENASNLNATIWLLVGIVGVSLLVWSFFSQTHKFLPEAASKLGRDYDLFFLIYSVPIVLIFFITHFLLFAFSYKYRFKVGRKVAWFPESNKLELIWTSVPLVVLLALGISTTGRWLNATGAPSEDAMHIKVTAMQFKWMMAYPGADGEFGARNIREYGELVNLLGLDPDDAKGYDDVYTDTIVVPVGKEVAFDLTALDVIHDFYLPHFRVKMDAIPGVPTSIKIKADKTTDQMRTKLKNPDFNFELACAELCGTGHWNMRKVLKVVSQQEFDEWISSQQTAKEMYYDSILAEREKKEARETDSEHETEEQNHDDSHEEESHEEEVDTHDETASL